MLKFICSLFFIFSTYLSAYEYNLSICAIFQDESPYLNEWIEYHHKKGVDHFYLYNNNSTDNYKEVLKPWIDKGIVELVEWNSQEIDVVYFCKKIQRGAYTDAVNKSKNITKWLALIDIDEFIVPKIDKTITECLERVYFDCGAVCINWQCFGTSHIAKLDPTKKSYEQLFLKMKWDNIWNRNFKTIVRPEYVIRCDVHFCYLNHPYIGTGVNTHKEPAASGTTKIYIDILQINHYWTRDEDYFYNMKIPRYKKWKIFNEDMLRRADEMNYEFDDSILK